MQFLTGKDYPHVCDNCKTVINTCAEVIRDFGEDTDDDEAPVNMAYDQGMFCGGHVCVNKPQGYN